MIRLKSLKECYESKIKEGLNADLRQGLLIQDLDRDHLVHLEGLGLGLVPDLVRGVDPALVLHPGEEDHEAEV